MTKSPIAKPHEIIMGKERAKSQRATNKSFVSTKRSAPVQTDPKVITPRSKLDEPFKSYKLRLKSKIKNS
jgi:hypothetical protein